MTEAVTVNSRLADIVASRPAAAAVLDELGIDYCCGGDRSLSEASDRTADEATALAARLDGMKTPDHRDWRDAPTGELIDYILATHHGYTRGALGNIDPLLQRVMQAHFRSHGELLTEIHRLFGTLKQELELHLLKEEELLFPAILSGDTSAGRLLDEMEQEHDGAGEILHELKDRTGGFVPPDNVCPSFSDLYRRLAELSADIHRHVYLENYVLAPRMSPSAGLR